MSNFRGNMTLKRAQVRGIIINQMDRPAANTFFKTKVLSRHKGLLKSNHKFSMNSSKGNQSNQKRA